jgi:hypothetical protein
MYSCYHPITQPSSSGSITNAMLERTQSEKQRMNDAATEAAYAALAAAMAMEEAEERAAALESSAPPNTELDVMKMTLKSAQGVSKENKRRKKKKNQKKRENNELNLENETQVVIHGRSVPDSKKSKVPKSTSIEHPLSTKSEENLVPLTEEEEEMADEMVSIEDEPEKDVDEAVMATKKTRVTKQPQNSFAVKCTMAPSKIQLPNMEVAKSERFLEEFGSSLPTIEKEKATARTDSIAKRVAASQQVAMASILLQTNKREAGRPVDTNVDEKVSAYRETLQSSNKNSQRDLSEDNTFHPFVTAAEDAAMAHIEEGKFHRNGLAQQSTNANGSASLSIPIGLGSGKERPDMKRNKSIRDKKLHQQKRVSHLVALLLIVAVVGVVVASLYAAKILPSSKGGNTAEAAENSAENNPTPSTTFPPTEMQTAIPSANYTFTDTPTPIPTQNQPNAGSTPRPTALSPSQAFSTPSPMVVGPFFADKIDNNVAIELEDAKGCSICGPGRNVARPNASIVVNGQSLQCGEQEESCAQGDCSVDECNSLEWWAEYYCGCEDA